MQPTGPFKRWSESVLGSMWVPPMLLLLPLLFAKFEKTIVVISIVVTVVYLAYGLITASVCAPWQKRRKLWIKKSTLSTILLSGYTAITIILISLIMLAVSLLVTKLENFAVNINLGLAIILFYIVVLLVSFVFAPYLTRKRIIARRTPMSGTYRILFPLAGVSGIGMIIAQLFMGTPYIVPIVIFTSAFLALMLLPVGTIKIYETITLYLNPENAA